MKIEKEIEVLEALIKNPSRGLPEDIFLFASRIVPMINVDLLIKNEKNNTLLTWRDDGDNPPGWHIIGGIIRYKEKIADRIMAVATEELGANVEYKLAPLAINELMHLSRKNRGHFISLLYECKLINLPDESIHFKNGKPKAGEWAWHDKYPDNMIPVHEIYRKFI